MHTEKLSLAVIIGRIYDWSRGIQNWHSNWLLSGCNYDLTQLRSIKILTAHCRANYVDVIRSLVMITKRCDTCRKIRIQNTAEVDRGCTP